ncbi:hypothetical protein M1L60_21640 [Actinoplanes sp. TRM 88003]|uniref:Uncharacterized protein n=1 Tax=Paractinoplanes aksuensis TaxID=2939490 RepID=A0ABT1DQS2_9ACTN|nr:hypothetical protein [Actinoplanes aksuensis]MCO8273198.1 hypothetical protein [Actinoplanes aksuensis]
MALVLIRMKLAVLSNSMTGGQAAWMVVGAVLGLAAAAATIGLAFAGDAGDLLAGAAVLWLLGWVACPLLGGSAVLRPGHFALLPLPRRRLAAGLLAVALVGVPGVVTAVAFLGLVPYGLRLGPGAGLTAVPAAALTLILVALAWWLGRAAHTRLTARGPEMLTHLRTGKAPTPTTATPPPDTRPWPQIIVYLTLGTILLFPQGLVPTIFLLTGVEARVWFLAMYLPTGWGTPVAALFVVTGALIWLKPSAQPEVEASDADAAQPIACSSCCAGSERPAQDL